MMTTPKPASELTGLVYGCTEIPSKDTCRCISGRYSGLRVVGVVFVILNIIFW